MRVMIETRLAYIEKELAGLRASIHEIQQQERAMIAHHNKLVDQAEILRSLLAEQENAHERRIEVDQPEAVCDTCHTDSHPCRHESECESADPVDG